MVQPFTTDNPPSVQSYSPPAAQIVVAELTFSDDALFAAPPANAPPTTDYMIVNQYENDGHKYVMGVTSPRGFQGRSVSIVQLASPTLILISQWTACQFRTKPNVPDPTSQDYNWVLLDVWPGTVMETIGPDGVTPLWRINGTYIYAHVNPSPNVFQHVVFPRPPWLKDSFPRNFPLTNLQQGLINQPTTGVGIGPGQPVVPPGGIPPGGGKPPG